MSCFHLYLLLEEAYIFKQQTAFLDIKRSRKMFARNTVPFPKEEVKKKMARGELCMNALLKQKLTSPYCLLSPYFLLVECAASFSVNFCPWLLT